MTAASLLSKPPTHCRDESGECVARRLCAHLRGNARVPRGNACRMKNTGENEKKKKKRERKETGGRRKIQKNGQKNEGWREAAENKVCERSGKDTKEIKEKKKERKGKERKGMAYAIYRKKEEAENARRSRRGEQREKKRKNAEGKKECAES